MWFEGHVNVVLKTVIAVVLWLYRLSSTINTTTIHREIEIERKRKRKRKSARERDRDRDRDVPPRAISIQSTVLDDSMVPMWQSFTKRRKEKKRKYRERRSECSFFEAIQRAERGEMALKREDMNEHQKGPDSGVEARSEGRKKENPPHLPFFRFSFPLLPPFQRATKRDREKEREGDEKERKKEIRSASYPMHEGKAMHRKKEGTSRAK